MRAQTHEHAAVRQHTPQNVLTLGVTQNSKARDKFQTCRLLPNFSSKFVSFCGLPLQKLGSAQPKDELWRDSDVRVPEHLRPHATTAYILNQRPGRLRVQDIKGAVAARRADLSAADAELRRVEAACGPVDALDDPSVPVDIRVRPLRGGQASRLTEA